MFKAEKVLYPTDFSDCSRSVLDYVTSFAVEHKSKLYLLYVCEYQGLPRIDESPIPERPDPERLEEIMQGLAKMVEGIKGLDVECLVSLGHPFNEIIRTSKDVGADLIIMATHGRTGFQNILIGSVAEKVVRHAACPVMTIKPDKKFMKE